MNDNIKGYFEAHPQIDCFYFTSDGLAYFNAAIASAHAAHLEDDAVSCVTRAQYEEAINGSKVEKTTTDDAAAADAAADTTTEKTATKTTKKNNK